ncbi:V-type ATP synthase subunit E [Enterococcus ratti]|uniref:V-type sodium ATPase subunit E n=1 Tax=Enterococcus ratti TaxID=150033 RepID=A0A1L8WQ19_9ENTE|nr:V-type ATP synthase subunit E [Enterococcus ratti]OJG83107.1 V-type sodium ATPase subunit E [Enterococcus ratti]
MNAIEKIITQINEEAQQERKRFEETKRKEIDQQFEEKRLQMEENFQKEKVKQLAEVEKKYRQLRSKQKMQVKQQILTEKQAILQRLFTEAVTQLENKPKEEQLELMKKMLQTLTINGKASLILGEKTAAYFTPSLMEEWQKGLPFELVLEEHFEKDQAGFIIESHGIQYNFLFSHLIKELQETMSAEIARKLFD